jgi:diacylglycerol kinase (ATP)
MKHQINSFKVAFQGIWYTIKSESHMRFHMTAGFYVILLSFFYNLSKAQWAIVILLIASIMVAEIFNTCLEQLCNLSTQSYDPIAKIAKDIAAGAVLALSFAAIVIGFLFYFDLAVIKSIALFLIANPLILVLFVLSIIISVLFVGFGPMGARRLYHKFKAKK